MHLSAVKHQCRDSIAVRVPHRTCSLVGKRTAAASARAHLRRRALGPSTSSAPRLGVTSSSLELATNTELPVGDAVQAYPFKLPARELARRHDGQYIAP